jgi:hypothetical protein
MLHYVHSSLIYNSQKLERTQMPLNGGMDTENLVHLHNGVLLSLIKSNEFMKFLGKWMDLEGIILSEVTQSQRTHMIFCFVFLIEAYHICRRAGMPAGCFTG